MDKKFRILMVVFFSVLLITANYSLFSGEKAMVECAGCGHKMEAGKGVTVDHHGKKLHFCGEKCKEAFEKKAAECTCKVTYKCPMKVCNYTSDKDGKCPKCGMALKKVEPRALYKCTTDGCKYTSHKEGKCPHCKTDLKKAECPACGKDKKHQKPQKKHMKPGGCSKDCC